MTKVEKWLKRVDTLVIKINGIKYITDNAEQHAKNLWDNTPEGRPQDALAYHDAYRQAKADNSDVKKHLEAILDVRDGIAQNGPVWQYRCLVRKYEKYVDSFMRIHSYLEN